MSTRRAPHYGPKPDLTPAERAARLEALVELVGRELDLIIPGDWEVEFRFPEAKPVGADSP